jgi:hypothetical protein
MFGFPLEIIFNILNFLVDAHDIIRLSKVCQIAYLVCDEFVKTTFSMTPCLLKFIKKICSTESITQNSHRYEFIVFYQINCKPLIIYSKTISRLFDYTGSFMNSHFQNDCIYFINDWMIKRIYDCRFDKFQELRKEIYSSVNYAPRRILGYPKIESLFVYRIGSESAFVYYFKPYQNTVPIKFESHNYLKIIKFVDTFPIWHIYVTAKRKIFYLEVSYLSKLIRLQYCANSYFFINDCESSFSKLDLGNFVFQTVKFPYRKFIVSFDNEVELEKFIQPCFKFQ